MNEPTDEPSDDSPSRGGSFARGCAIAAGVAFLLFALVFGSCFI